MAKTKTIEPIKLIGDQLFINAGYRRKILSEYVLLSNNLCNINGLFDASKLLLINKYKLYICKIN
jgi:hypothetical protein